MWNLIYLNIINNFKLDDNEKKTYYTDIQYPFEELICL